MNPPNNPAARAPRKSSPLLWWVVGVFLVQIAVWTAWITFASKHRVAEVPLAPAR